MKYMTQKSIHFISQWPQIDKFLVELEFNYWPGWVACQKLQNELTGTVYSFGYNII